METSLLQHIQTERGPIRMDELLSDMPQMAHAIGFPQTPSELRTQLEALVKASLVRCWEVDGVEWVELRPVAVPVDPQGSLFT